MSNSESDAEFVTPDLLLRAYSAGVFPMAESADDPGLFWVDPEFRGVLPLNGFHIPRRLRRDFRNSRFRYSVNEAFEDVLAACAGENIERNSTWINPQIKHLYRLLHNMGHCHSVETWNGSDLVGGLYGVSLGGAFFGESMFSTATNASKFALIQLVFRLRVGGFQLLDTQFTTQHLEQFGVVEIPREKYRRLLADALEHVGEFNAYDGGATSESILQSLSHTS